MAAGNSSGDTDRAGALEHPYSALALMLALSGSERWPTTAAATTREEGEANPVPPLDSEGKGGRSSWAAMSGEGEDQEEGGELYGFGGDSSRLWSTDSEHDGDSEAKDDEEGEEEAEEENGTGVVLQGDAGDAGRHEWLQAFEDDGERSPRTDGARIIHDGWK